MGTLASPTRLAGALLVAAVAAGPACGPKLPDETTPVALPFAVSDQFTASGFMGDAATTGVVTSHVDDDHCLPRPTAAVGSCYAFDVTAPASGGMGWAGVVWQTPVSNWGQLPGKPIAPGAAAVQFQAAITLAGGTVQFRAGGLTGGVDPASGRPYPYGDTFQADSSFALAPALAQFQVPFPAGATYDRVLGGFAWIAQLAPGTSTTIYLDDIRWVP